MKRFVAVWRVCLVIGFGTLTVFAQDNNSKGKNAEKKVQDVLPAQPPKESSGTAKGSGLKPYVPHKPDRKFKEVPPPPKEKKDKK